MQKLRGTGTAIVTPFTKNGAIDKEALIKLVNYQVANGVDYLVVLGTTAETATLTSEEKALVMSLVVDANQGRLPLVVGVGGNNTAEVIAQINKLDTNCFDAVLSVSPYYNKPSQEGIYQHFNAIASSSSLPIIIYNVPSRTGSNMVPETVQKLSLHNNIVGVKEAKGDMEQALKMIQMVASDFLVISGDDSIALPMTLAGGAGVISVLGQAYPREFSDIIRYGLHHQSKEAFELFYPLLDTVGLIFEEGNPVGIKKLLQILNVIPESTVRLPLVEATSVLTEKLNQSVKEKQLLSLI